MIRLFASLLFLLTACSGPNLSVRSEYYSRDNLASVHVDTPDPRKESDAFGQRLIINWSMPESTFSQGPIELLVKVRLKNGIEKVSKVALKERQGQTFYPIFGDDYLKKGGLQSYLVQIRTKGKVLTESRHKLWVEKLKTGSSTARPAAKTVPVPVPVPEGKSGT